MEAKRIADQLRRSAHGPAWHGPSMKEVLREVTAAHALQQVCGASHCIAELVLHVAAWARASAAAIDGVPVPQELPDDWTPVSELGDKDWERIQKEAMRELDNIVEKAEALGESRLTEIVPGRKFDYYFMLHGVAQHTIYHAGQIAILKTQISASE